MIIRKLRKIFLDSLNRNSLRLKVFLDVVYLMDIDTDEGYSCVVFLDEFQFEEAVLLDFVLYASLFEGLVVYISILLFITQLYAAQTS